MRIGHFAQPLSQGAKTGVSWYTWNLIRELSFTGLEEDLFVFDFLERNQLRKKMPLLFSELSEKRKIHWKVNKYIPNSLYCRLPGLFSLFPFDTLFNADVDIHHAHNYFLPYRLKTPSVVTIYDMVYHYFPQTMDNRNLELLRQVLPRSVKESTRILTISENSKKEIIEVFQIDPEKIHIAYPGYDRDIYKEIPEKTTRVVLESMHIQKPFILYMGTLEPRKNIDTLIKAYASLPDVQKTHDLVLSGSVGWNVDSLFQLVERYNLGENIRFTGYVTSEQQTALYNGAVCFVFPSLYEGFGMPVLEAMACGCPVITSNSSSLPEAAGEAAILVDPLDVEALAVAIRSLVEDGALRENLKMKNKKQISRFSWHNTAKSVRNLYESII